MKTLFWGLLFLIVSLIIQFITWKIKVPKRHTNAVLLIFILVLTVEISILVIISSISSTDFYLLPKNFLEFLRLFLFCIPLIAAYILVYPAIEVDSPSLVIIMNIAKGGKNGLAKSELYNILTNEILVMPRIDDLLREKLVQKEGENYKLTQKGYMFIRIFIIYRNFIKITDKGG
jgi:hypothetical protein